MGYFKAKAIVVKEVRRTGLTIVFYDSETIYVEDPRQGWVVFHRWGSPHTPSENKRWKTFRHLLLVEKKIDLLKCCRLAFQWDVSSQKAKHAPDLSKFNIEERICI